MNISVHGNNMQLLKDRYVLILSIRVYLYVLTWNYAHGIFIEGKKNKLKHSVYSVIPFEFKYTCICLYVQANVWENLYQQVHYHLLWGCSAKRESLFIQLSGFALFKSLYYSRNLKKKIEESKEK